jgi:hypothetical protein
MSATSAAERRPTVMRSSDASGATVRPPSASAITRNGGTLGCEAR